MSLKGKAAIIGIGELQPMKIPPKRTGMGLIAEAASRAIYDAGLTKEDIEAVHAMIAETVRCSTGAA